VKIHNTFLTWPWYIWSSAARPYSIPKEEKNDPEQPKVKEAQKSEDRNPRKKKRKRLNIKV